MPAKIIGFNHHVSKVVNDYHVNDKHIVRTDYIVNRKDDKNVITIMYELNVIDAINSVGFQWYDVYNYLDEMFNEVYMKELEPIIDKHTVFTVFPNKQNHTVCAV